MTNQLVSALCARRACLSASWSNAGGPQFCVLPAAQVLPDGPLGRPHQPHARLGLGLAS
jgi:hypothetical protein